MSSETKVRQCRRPVTTARRTRSTYRARLTLHLVLLSLVVITAACLAVYFGVRQALRANLDGALWSIARAEIASATDGPGGKIHVHEEEVHEFPAAAGVFYEKFAVIEDTEGRLVARTRNLMSGPTLLTDPARKLRSLRGEPSVADIAHGADTLRAIYYPVRAEHGKHYVAVIAITRTPMDRALRSLAGILILALLGVGGAAALGAKQLASRLTHPLERIAEAALNVGDENLTQRIPLVSSDAELEDVTSVLNDMLARLEEAFGQQQRLIRSQQRFIADASHELRSPLANLRGTVEVILRRPRTAEDYRQTLASLEPEIERLSRLVNDLLTLSRADVGRLTDTSEACDLQYVAESAADAHRARAATREIRLELDSREPILVRGDHDRLRQVLDNLLDNALRYAPRESTVTLRVWRMGDWGLVSVRDQGPGIPLEDQPHLFERFYRADRSRTRDSGGMGLGLAIVRAIVEELHGSVRVVSTPDHGATFILALPLDLEQQRELNEPALHSDRPQKEIKAP